MVEDASMEDAVATVAVEPHRNALIVEALDILHVTAKTVSDVLTAMAMVMWHQTVQRCVVINDLQDLEAIVPMALMNPIDGARHT